MWFLALFSVVGSFVLVGLSVFPGVLEQIPTSITQFLGGGFGLFATGAASWHLIRPTSPGRPRQRKSALIVLVCLAATPALLLTSTPRWLAFSRHQPQFEALLSQAPPPGNRAVVPLNADLNVYWIDHWGTDVRGGTYFRTLSGRVDGRADRRSFGFAYKPNAEGSPFGNDRYELNHLTGDWYSFSAIDER